MGGVGNEDKIQSLISNALIPINQTINSKRNITDSYNISEIDTKLALYRTISDSYSKAQIDAKFPTITGLAVYNFTVAVGKTLRFIYTGVPFRFFIIFTSGDKKLMLVDYAETVGTLKSLTVGVENATTWTSGVTWPTSSQVQYNSFKIACNVTVIPLQNITNAFLV